MIFEALLKNTIGTVLNRVVPDKNARAAAVEELNRLDLTNEFQLLEGQLKINAQEAAHKSIFVAGWRPFIGWVCGCALAFNFIVSPMARFILLIVMDNPPVLPVLDVSTMMPVLLGMLGLGGMRSFERIKGVARQK